MARRFDLARQHTSRDGLCLIKTGPGTIKKTLNPRKTTRRGGSRGAKPGASPQLYSPYSAHELLVSQTRTETRRTGAVTGYFAWGLAA